MKKLIEAYRREGHVPYLIVLFMLAQAILIIVSLFGWGTGGVGTFFILSKQMWPYPFELVLSIMINIVVLCVFGVAFVRAVKHSRALRNEKKDERELLHDLLVARMSYDIVVVVLVVYAINDPLMLVFLAAILVARLWRRVQLEMQQ